MQKPNATRLVSEKNKRQQIRQRIGNGSITSSELQKVERRDQQKRQYSRQWRLQHYEEEKYQQQQIRQQIRNGSITPQELQRIQSRKAQKRDYSRQWRKDKQVEANKLKIQNFYRALREKNQTRIVSYDIDCWISDLSSSFKSMRQLAYEQIAVNYEFEKDIITKIKSSGIRQSSAGILKYVAQIIIKYANHSSIQLESAELICMNDWSNCQQILKELRQSYNFTPQAKKLIDDTFGRYE